MWPWNRKREVKTAQDVAYSAWCDAINAHNDAKRRGDTRDINRTHIDLLNAMNERLKLGC